ncbi:hypothetical protein M434DRAFT_85029 [Hypoxylon sp. CO27-5]|nr:hypothetical protein M434DRAFT_85029 [Hypoxylon sp. CO27-5]
MGTIRYDKPASLIVGAVVMEAVAALCVGLRFFSRRWKRQRIIISDWLILAAFTFGTGLTVLEIYGIKEHALAYPIGSTFENQEFVTERLNKAEYIEFSYLLIGILALGLLKLSVCFLYWDLFAMVMFRHFLLVWMSLIAVWTAAFVLSMFLECRSHFMASFGPLDDYTKYCESAIPIGWSLVGTDVGTDVITLIIPIPAILKSQLSKRSKVLALLTFMIGALSVSASAVKAYIYITATQNVHNEDAIVILTGISIWNLAEVQVGVVAACGPVLRPIVLHLMPTEIIVSFIRSWRWHPKKSSESTLNYAKMTESEDRLRVLQLVRQLSEQDGIEEVGRSYEIKPRAQPI